MAQGVSRVIEGMALWDNNKENADEAFWQIKLSESSYILSQVFAAPVVFIGNNAYVGGTQLDNSGASKVDYLLAFEASGSSVLVEIKTPMTPLFGRRYRQNFPQSTELSGSIIQVLDYKNKLNEHFESLVRGSEHKFTRINPRCVVIIGNGEKQLNDEQKRRSFEMIRGNQRDVEIVTYDELFKKVEVLIHLFYLKRDHPAKSA
jgi:hypothetical protein